MLDHTELHILPESTGTVPRLSGVNVECHLYADESNLWDWLADSGFQVTRQFHPELNLRRTPFEAAWVEGIESEEAYDAFRKVCLGEIRKAEEEPDYLFMEEIPWLGTPDKLVAKTIEAGVEPLLSVGAHPRMFSRPLLNEAGELDWGAACCMYEYSATLFWRYAEHFGVREFTTINEPENQLTSWYFPPRLSWLEDSPPDAWRRLFRDDDNPTGDGLILIESMAEQYAAVVRIQRQALEDVRHAMTNREQAAQLKLHGPTNVVWTQLWEKAEPWLDSLDVHQYRPDRRAMRQVFRLVSSKAAAAGKPLSCTEFNRQSGGFKLQDFPFNDEAALEVLMLYLEALCTGGVGPADCDLACLYIFAHPSTHRNYKHLLYGDMNQLDWSCADSAPWKRDASWYPTAEEMQIRNPTPAYRMVRMVNRMLHTGVRASLHQTGMVNPTSAGPDDLHYGLVSRAFRIDRNSWICWVINPGDTDCKGVRVVWPVDGFEGAALVVRGGPALQPDQVLLYEENATGTETLTLPAKGVSQWILTPSPLHGLNGINLLETSLTPGSLSDGLQQYHTSRLQVLNIDTQQPVPDAWVTWTSSKPEVVRVESSGLVQRMRSGGGEITLTATTVDGTHTASVPVPEDHPAPGLPGPMRHLGTVGLGESRKKT